MPLFGSHKEKDNVAHREAHALNHGRTGGAGATAAGPGTVGTVGTGGAGVTAARSGTTGTGGAHGSGIPGDGYNNQGLNNQPGLGNEYGAGPQVWHDGSAKPGHQHTVGNDYNRTTQSGIPTSQPMNAGATNERHGQGHSTTGKIEKAVGTVIGSSSLKHKGELKEQEARALNVQSSELAEAERLEREAQLHRDRAVGHGAHPENRRVGGI